MAYDEDRKLWYCDVRIEPTAGYTPYLPFVRLSLVRYQPYSIKDTHLSRVALADFAQLAADRTVSVVPVVGSPNDWTVTVGGIMANVKSADAPARKVEVMVERKGTESGDLGWVPMSPKPVSLLPSPWGIALFSGQVRFLPGNGDEQYRLLIKEYERLVADAEDRVLTPTDSPRPVWRLVFADVVVL